MTKTKMFALLAISGFTFLSSSASAEESYVLKRPLLTLDAAQKIADSAIKTCRKKGVNVTVTVVDRTGRPLVVMRDTLAMPVSIEISRLKAFSALNFNTATETLEGRFKGPGSIAKVDGVLASAGGIPINAGGNILGGIGVSGAPSGETDKSCATAGLEAIKTDLEMSM